MTNIPSRKEIEREIEKYQFHDEIDIRADQATRILKALWEGNENVHCMCTSPDCTTDQRLELLDEAMHAASALYKEKP